MNEGNSTKLNGYFEVDETYENENWIRTSIRTFAFGKNRNQSDIVESSMSEFSKAQKTIGGIPIVAKYNDEKDDLEGHNVTLRKNKDGEYEFYHDTTPLGFTSPTATFHTEDVNEGTESNPDYKTYVTINDVYLWKRFDATRKILEWKDNNISTKVSMEIDNVIGSFNEDGYFSITDFSFSAIAALGSDVEPCFKRAEIQLYTVNDFKADLKQLMYELTAQTEVEVKGGNVKMEETNQEFEATVETTETQVEDVQTEITEEVVVEVVESNEQEATDEFVEETQDEATVETEEVQEETQESTDEVVVEDFEVETSIVDSVEEITVVEADDKFTQLSADFEALKVEVEELREFKRKTQEAELSAKFENQLSSEELTQVFEQSKDSTIEDIEKELFALVGKKNFSFKTEKKEKAVIAFNINKKQEEENPYGNFFE